jgi:glycosyltransferase involved in cell wall biosynthesis
VYWAFCFHHIAAAARRAGIPVVFLCHNVVDHESAAWKRRLARWVLGTSDRFVVHHQEGRRQLLEAFPGATVRVHPHPTHVAFPAAHGTLPRRAALELLFFGFVRPYKGLDVLIDAMALLRAHDTRLTVAGEFWSDVDPWRARIASLGLQERIELLPRYHSDEELAELFARADVVVLPYRSATGSAVIPLAYRYGKPVIASNVGGLGEVIHHGETGLLVEAASATELAKAIASMTPARAASMRPAIEALAASLTWEGLANAVLEALSFER